MATQSDFRVKKGLIVGTTDTANPEAGTFTYDADFETVDLTLDANVNARLAQDHYFYVKAGATITKGDVVYASGAVGNSGKIEASPYIANNTIDESVVLGVAAEDIATGNFGYVAQFGSIRRLDASGGLTTDGETWNNGDILYASPTYAGELTKTKPSAPNQDIPIAFVISNNGSSGTIAVRASRLGYHMDEVHDVEITSIADKDLLVYNTSNSRWENGKTLGDITTGTISASDVTLTGELNGPATFYIDPAPHDPDTDGATNGLVVIRGDLQIDGTTTTVNSTTMTVDDLNITLASGAANAAAADGGGITIDDGSGGTEPTILYGATPNAFNFNRNVGINTTITGGTTADTYLHIYSNEANITPLIKLQNNTGEDDSSEGVSIDFVGSGDKTAVGSRIIATRAAAGAHMDLRFHTQRNNFAMIIDSNQNVGIGTDSPGQLLQVESTSTAKLRWSYDAPRYGEIGRRSDGIYEFASYENGSSLVFGTISGSNGSTIERMRIYDSGDISIKGGNGNNNFYWDASDSYNNGQLKLGTGSGVSSEAMLAVSRNYGDITNPLVHFDITGNDGRVLRVSSDTARTDMQIFDVINNNGTAFAVRGDGNVGIGTDDPSTKLEVQGVISSRTTNNISNIIMSDDGAGNESITTNRDAMIVSIPRDPTQKPVSVIHGRFEASANKINIGGMSTHSSGNWDGTGVQGATEINFYTTSAVNTETFSSTNPSMSIKNNGHVGIGTPNPTVEFEVRDDSTWDTANFSSNSSVGSGITLNAINTGVKWSLIAQGTTGGGNDNNLGFHLTNAGTSGESTGYKFVMTPAGSLGIGTPNPVSILHAKGGSIVNERDNGGIVFIKDGAVSSTNNDYYGALLRIDQNGYHYTSTQGGFGSAANDLALMHHGNIAFATTSATGDNSTNYATGRMIILENGNVGIGTRSPTASLHVRDTSSDADVIIETASQSLRIDQNSIRTTTSSAVGMFTNNNSSNGFRIENDGRMIIGNTSGQTNVKLTVNGNLKMGSAAHSSWANTVNDIGGLDVIVGSGSHALQLWDDNYQTRPRFEVQRDGHVWAGQNMQFHENNTSSTAPFDITNSSSTNNFFVPNTYGAGNVNQTYRHCYTINAAHHWVLFRGGGGNTVFNTYAFISGDHYRDINVWSITLYYSDLKIKIIQNNSADKSIWVAGNTYNNNVYGLSWRIMPVEPCTIQHNPSSSQSTGYHIHHATGGEQFTGTDTFASGSGPTTY
jgi:hypothetical protein